jgi:ankyrin repeat protein
MQDLQLIEAVKTGNIAIVKELIEAGADVNQQDEGGWTPLNWAAGKGDIALVELLLEKGADVFIAGRDRRTPYMIALGAGHTEVVKLLRTTEEKIDRERSSISRRRYCRAYYLKEMRKFSDWTESKINWNVKSDNEINGPEGEFADDDVVFLHQDLAVTRSMWHGESIIFNEISPEWERFCADVLMFRAPDDLDLIVQAK